MKLTLRRPDDFHVHLRQGDLLPRLVQHSARHFGRALVMPNTVPAIGDHLAAAEYRDEIVRHATDGFTPLMTIKITADTTPDIVAQAKAAGVVAAKLYPVGVTTNSADGVGDIKTILPVIEALQAADMVLSVHGELPGSFCLDREFCYLPIIKYLSDTFPRLRIVLEHVTTAEGVALVRSLPDRVAGTITWHHLEMTLDDVVGDKLRPWHFCKPLPKRASDRQELVAAVRASDPKFFFGSDSAPWEPADKYAVCGCAGVFTSPVAVLGLLTTLDKYDAVTRFENFTSRYGADFYRLPYNDATIQVIRRPWRVPDSYDGIVPFFAGETLTWDYDL